MPIGIAAGGGPEEAPAGAPAGAPAATAGEPGAATSRSPTKGSCCAT